ncbi:hypothetical protein CORT_0B07290 [Candida orthopsilosis Co 90-125]|uniref:G-patch domain-containing protein n=1 Tax=Candida orthopsilosis (strain 90-125) TaxID=1136231 RepID=H8X1N1_CANO9|nr:hypothetical protein CORT_0B07290 [Candida orthopsilosis Co 90-125]CCG22436.1 hypothetical protein CORT_0B07290 [Candida orthopsilosis Co 90-125]
MGQRPHWSISFVKPGSELDQDDPNDSLNRKRSRPMMSSIHSEYSDLEDDVEVNEHKDSVGEDRDSDSYMDVKENSESNSYEDSDVDMDEVGEDFEDTDCEDSIDSSSSYSTHLQHKTRQPVQSLGNFNISKTYEKYGIGALLMKKMGFEEGKGIGSRQSGIIAPLNANPNKGRLGVGAKESSPSWKEKGRQRQHDNKDAVQSRRFSDRQSSDDFDDYTRMYQPSEFEVITFNIYRLIMDFGDLGVDVPTHLRDWAMSVRSTATEEDIDRLKYEYGHLKDVWYDISSINEEEEGLDQELGYADDDGFIAAQYEKLLLIAKRCENLPLNDLNNVQIEDVLESLLQLPLTNDIVESMVVTILKPKINSLISVSLYDYDNQKETVVPTLNKYTEILDPQNAVSSEFYAYLLGCFSLKFDQLLNNDSVDSENGAAADEILTTVTSIWLDLSNPNLKNHVLNQIVRAVIVPYFEEQVHQWDLLTDITLSEKFFDLLQILCVVGIDDNFVISEAVDNLVSKVKNYLTFGAALSVWYNLGDSKQIDSAKLQITLIMQHLVPELESFRKSTKSSVQDIFKSSFASWVKSLSFVDATPTTFESILYLSTFLPQKSRFAIMQFLVFNNWIVSMIRIYRADPQAVPTWYARWYQYFTTKLIDDNPKEIDDLIHWYLSKALDFIRSDFDPVVCQDLPKHEGELFPKPAQVLQPIEKQTVNGIPAHRLQITFRDVVSEYCNKNKIVMKKLKRAVHKTKGVPIFKLTKGSAIRYGYIDNEVLWISHSQNPNKDELYEPISLDTLVDNFNTCWI